jgi:hypothetical protein
LPTSIRLNWIRKMEPFWKTKVITIKVKANWAQLENPIVIWGLIYCIIGFCKWRILK